jgi:ribokinase/sulfofructose kinase
MPEVVAVGSAIRDEYLTLSNLPAADGGAFVRARREGFGGVAANVACACARLGRDSGTIARLGSDGDADAVEADLRERGVDTERVRRGEEPSTYSLVLRSGGERMVITGGEAAAALELREPDWPYLRGADAVVTNAYVPERVAAELVKARVAGEIDALAFDLSGPLAELRNRGTEPGTVDAAVRACDLFVVGEVALASYLEYHGVSRENAVSFLREQGLTRGALTRGAAGATLVTPEGTVDVEAFDVDVVDPTGAGDAFTAGLVDAWLLEGRPAREAGRFAAAAAALNCTGDGARGGLATRGEVEALSAGQPGNQNDRVE